MYAVSEVPDTFHAAVLRHRAGVSLSHLERSGARSAAGADHLARTRAARRSGDGPRGCTLVGTHDFASFCRKATGRSTAARTPARRLESERGASSSCRSLPTPSATTWSGRSSPHRSRSGAGGSIPKRMGDDPRSAYETARWQRQRPVTRPHPRSRWTTPSPRRMRHCEPWVHGTRSGGWPYVP